MLRVPRTGAIRPARRALAWLALAWVALAPGPPASANTTPSNEYLIKAAYLYNFALFVEWPAAAFSRPDSPIVIGVVGADPFGAALDQTVRQKVVRNRSIRVERLQPNQDLSRCHILFVSGSESDRIGELAQRLDGRSVLVVGDTSGLAKRGATITFAVHDNRVRLEVNVDAAKRSRLTISSQLLNISTIVRGP